ncbi:vacuolar protein sorting-associated protein 33 [Haematococcus lacustris]|uniref:Vacuolar protein sorting-associated protein 33 n=1 Tax=Haematococcus lacustris TaxID=44745 RepID=A0A6A0A134_HAELA|nr:vacuolar protein sorting-associated protein 33 [Haematococcus lacustris]
MSRGNRVQLPTLDTGPVPLIALREQARSALIDAIDSRRGGRKALFIDVPVSNCLSCLDTRLTELLTEHGVARQVMAHQATTSETAPIPPPQPSTTQPQPLLLP